MIKKTVQYTDFDGNPAEDTLHFNLNAIELSENLHLKARFEEMQETFSGEPKELATEDILKFLELVKDLMRLAYGVRMDEAGNPSETGKFFEKSDSLWNRFKQTPVYDTFLYGLFKNPEEMNDFLVDILPQDLREQAEAELAAQESGRPVPQDYKPKAIKSVKAAEEVELPKTPEEIEIEELQAKIRALQDERFGRTETAEAERFPDAGDAK